MKNLFLKLLACLLVAAMLMTIASVSIMAEVEETGDEEAADTAATDVTDDSALADGDEASTEGDAAPEDGDAAPTEGDAAPEDGDAAPEDGDAAPTEGDAAPEDGDAATEDGDAATEDGEDSDEEIPAEEAVYMTDEEAIAECQIAAENDRFILYYNPGTEEFQLERIGLYDKKSGDIYWTSPINAMCDDATARENLKLNRLSNISYQYGNATDLITSQAFNYSYRESTQRGNTSMEVVDGGLKVTYKLRTAAATVPVYFVLEDDYLSVYIKTDEIRETQGYKEDVKEDQEATSDTIILTEIGIAPYMAAAEPNEDGYIFIPDGSGAVINFNNGKGTYSDYSQTVYGRDITQVKDVEPDMTEQATMPVMALVKGNHGLVMIASAGDTFADAHASVSYSKNDNSWYNSCYFSFTVRSTDTYSMTGDSSSIIVLEKGDGSIRVDKLEVRYYPVNSDNETVSIGEIADVYRNYLIDEKGLTVKEDASKPSLYIDFFGGTRKSKSILGIPVALKTAYTPFNKAADIVDALSEMGVDSMVVNYNDWSDDSMNPKIDTGDSVASILGGKSDYKKMLKDFSEKGVDYYATVSGITFKSNGNGFWTLFNTAYRVSKSYSRQYSYNIAYGTPDSGVAPALLSPRSIPKLAKKVSKNLGKYEQGAGLGLVSNTLWSDFSTKYPTNRCVTADYITDYYKSVIESNGKVIADAPNAYLLPYVNRISDLTLQSSQFKLTDYDVPFYQMVLHGYVDYASEAINGTPDTTVAVLKAIAAGSNIHFDFIYEETSELINTSYVDLFYANYKGWIDEAAKAYKLVNEVLSPAEGAIMDEYVVEGSKITTVYSNGYKTVVDLSTGDITANGKTYNYTEYVKGGTN